MHQKFWTEDDDYYFVDIIAEEVMEKNLTLRAALKIAAPILNRSEVACHYRWNYVIKQYLEGSELLEKISANNPTVGG